MKKIIKLFVHKEEKSKRVDIFINKKEPSLSRTRIKNLILKSNLKINDHIIINPSKKVLSGDKRCISAIMPASVATIKVSADIS